MINRGWNPRVQKPMVYQPRSGLNLETLRLRSVATYVVILSSSRTGFYSLPTAAESKQREPPLRLRALELSFRYARSNELGSKVNHYSTPAP